MIPLPTIAFTKNFIKRFLLIFWHRQSSVWSLSFKNKSVHFVTVHNFLPQQKTLIYSREGKHQMHGSQCQWAFKSATWPKLLLLLLLNLTDSSVITTFSIIPSISSRKDAGRNQDPKLRSPPNDCFCLGCVRGARDFASKCVSLRRAYKWSPFDSTLASFETDSETNSCDLKSSII